MKKNETDISFLPGEVFNPLFQSIYNIVELSQIAFSAPYQCGQVIKEPKNLKKTDFSSFLFENWNLLSCMLIGYLLVFFVSFIFLKNNFPSCSKLKKLKLILSKLLFDDPTQLRAFSSSIALIFIFFNLFLFILISLLTNFIKTEAVIVNTDELIDSEQKLLSSKKLIYISEFDFKHYSSFLKSSVLFKLGKKIIEDNRYVTFENLMEMLLKGQSSSFFLFDNKYEVLRNLLPFSVMIKNPIIFMKPTNYHESNQVYYMRKNLDKRKKKFIHQWYVNDKTILLNEFNLNFDFQGLSAIPKKAFF